MSGLCGAAPVLCDVAAGMRAAGGSLSGAVDEIVRSAPVWLLGFWAAAVAAMLASFTGVLVDRVPRAAGWYGDPDAAAALTGPSACEGCGVRISPLALVPVVGWLVVGGRCGSCDGRVPAIYPTVEGAGALVALSLVMLLPGPSALWGLLLFWGLGAAVWFDLRYQEIPDLVTVPLGALGLVQALAVGATADAVSGCLVAAGLVWVAFKTFGKREFGVSYGDVALAAAVGAWVGLAGVLPFLFVSSVAFIAHAAPVKARDGEGVPMGPALCVGAAVVWTVTAVAGS